ncbi:MAG: OsmC family protein [Actinobacteria bacterium]|nr:OsmC family protein [Actinomycetota bacterium]
MPVRRSTAEWRGSLKEGSGSMRLASGLYEGPFTYSSRFEEGAGTNPEELVGAAHAGCFSMFLAGLLTDNGHPPDRINTSAAVRIGAGPTIDRIELHTEAAVPGISDAEFQDLAAQAKVGCPVSKALAAVPEITLKAKLVD